MLRQIVNLFLELDEDNEDFEKVSNKAPKKIEMLTIKECCDVIQGVSEHTIRKLVRQDKIKYVRTGEGKRGKILVNKADLISYFQDKN